MLPLGHENSIGKRFRVVTIILLVTNLLAFVLSSPAMHKVNVLHADPVLASHILVLKARNSDVIASPQAQQMIDEFRKKQPQAWAALTDENRQPADAWESEHLLDPDRTPERLQAEMNFLCHEFITVQTKDTSLTARYAFRPFQPTLGTYISHQFLHAGWLHLLTNLWMLWLFGIVLEDLWGPFLVLGLYLVAGAFSAGVYSFIAPDSIIPMLGASGSIAGLAGALLTRYPKLEVRFSYPAFAPLRTEIFFAPMYILVPVWFVVETFYSLGETGIAHWAYLSGFLFGAAVGGAAYTTLKPKVATAPVSAVTTPQLDQPILQASELLDRFDPDSCILELRAYLKKKPDSLEGWQLMLRAQDTARRYTAQRDETLPNLVRLSFVARDIPAAVRYLERYRNLGGPMLPPDMWLELGKKYERQHLWDAAIHEYEQLGYFYHQLSPVSVTALVSAARIHLSLKRPVDAERLYRAAQDSPIAHLELDALIQQGLKDCAASPYYVAQVATSV